MVWAAKTMHISCWTALTYANLILITQAQAAFFKKKRLKVQTAFTDIALVIYTLE